MLYRRQERIPGDLGTAVTSAHGLRQRGEDSGTGVAFTRDPASGAQGVYGDYLVDAQGEDVVAGIRNTVPLSDLEKLDKKSYDELMSIMADAREPLPRPVRHRVHHRARQLWMLQTRVGKRTAEAAFRIACRLVDQGLIDGTRPCSGSPGPSWRSRCPGVHDEAERNLIDAGTNASPGAAVGKAVFDSSTAVAGPSVART